MKILVAGIGKGRMDWADEASGLYVDRIRHYFPIDERRIRPSGFQGDIDEARRQDDQRLLALLEPGDRVVVLDERGRSLSTLALQEWFERGLNQGVKRMVFLLGGPFGHGDAVRGRADLVCSMSPWVLNHEVARVVLMEQIYRVQTLIRGEPYHH